MKIFAQRPLLNMLMAIFRLINNHGGSHKNIYIFLTKILIITAEKETVSDNDNEDEGACGVFP